MCDEFEVILGDLSQEFLKDLMCQFVDYSVAIARVEKGNPNSFTPLGAGTFVKKNNRYGILTAHHCLHRFDPEVSIGPQGNNCLLLIFKNGNHMIIEPKELFEHELTRPISDEYGPDLTFIEIAASERLSTLRAIVSFWNLDRNFEDIVAQYGNIQTPLASIGYPEENCNSLIEGRCVHRWVYYMTFLNAIEEGDISEYDDWDYIERRCFYSQGNNIPTSFGGVSGGAIWAFKLEKSKSSGKLSIGDYALVGVTFYQTALENDQRILRGHFIRSIYDIAWRDS